MKKVIILCSIFLSLNTVAQCVTCKSLEEAEKNPEMVKSIQINPYDGGELKIIPITIEKFINLEELYLSDLELKVIPKEIGKLLKLKSLGFAGNKLKELPQEIFLLTNLEELILFSNDFSKEYKKKIQKDVKIKLPKTKLMID